MIGILSGALLYTGFHPLKAVETTFTIMGSKLGDNINICIFLVLLGILVSLITKSGASRAYGEWAVKTIRSRRGASFATSFLGMFIFVDDYFNCLTVGTVMRPVTDKYNISRAKLAYIIDATAAPVLHHLRRSPRGRRRSARPCRNRARWTASRCSSRPPVTCTRCSRSRSSSG